MFSGASMGFGAFLILGSKGGGKNFRMHREGGRKISDASMGGGQKFWLVDFSESLGKIKIFCCK